MQFKSKTRVAFFSLLWMLKNKHALLIEIGSGFLLLAAVGAAGSTFASFFPVLRRGLALPVGGAFALFAVILWRLAEHKVIVSTADDEFESAFHRSFDVAIRDVTATFTRLLLGFSTDRELLLA